ncbi:hypothetical protein [Streptomyces sp. WMMB 714]|uniref:hypothetical protein n=1 Tax=Streptomyces sp. WMMB 714 TaxID=1286822 RepID=UPI00131D1E73|nr:hypothetical protein [Streptomyces sp. WMMB 714]
MAISTAGVSFWCDFGRLSALQATADGPDGVNLALFFASSEIDLDNRTKSR